MYSEEEGEFTREHSWKRKFFFRNIFWYEMLLNVLLLTVYDEGRAQFGVYEWAGIVSFLLIGIPAILYTVMIRVQQH
jgi:hypothetical protein